MARDTDSNWLSRSWLVMSISYIITQSQLNYTLHRITDTIPYTHHNLNSLLTMILTILIGPMRSGKSTLCCSKIRGWGVKNCAVIMKSICAKRREPYDEMGMVITHLEEINPTAIPVRDYVIIDDGQFFSGYRDLVRSLSQRGTKELVICGLDSWSTGSMCEWLQETIPLANKVKKLECVCACGQLAVLTSKVGGDKDALIEVGDIGSTYVSKCRDCMFR